MKIVSSIEYWITLHIGKYDGIMWMRTVEIQNVAKANWGARIICAVSSMWILFSVVPKIMYACFNCYCCWLMLCRLVFSIFSTNEISVQWTQSIYTKLSVIFDDNVSWRVFRYRWAHKDERNTLNSKESIPWNYSTVYFICDSVYF